MSSLSEMNGVERSSILMITLDSCRYDTFLAADAPNLKAVGPLHRAMAPSHFTFASHMAMFTGTTPGDPTRREPMVNPKFARIFKMDGGRPGNARAWIALSGRTIMEGLRKVGYVAIGTGGVRWFNPAAATSEHLTETFDEFYYPGDWWSLRRQLKYLASSLEKHRGRPLFMFLNVGETHVPYYHEGADWELTDNPCEPFSDTNDAEKCRYRQRACLEWVDQELEPLLRLFAGANTLICGDHGDCWGEDGLWEHGFHHHKTLEVPLLFRLPTPPPDFRRMG